MKEMHMADQLPYSGSDDDTSVGSDCGATTSPPRWVKVGVVVLVIALVLLMVVLHLTGVMGPGLHGG
jgi:hypothetical protein